MANKNNKLKTTNTQRVANRRNAKKSTGPKTQSGKIAASKNALKHGLLSKYVVIHDENQADFDQFRERMIEQFTPEGELEYLMTDRVVSGFWRLQRVARIESELFNKMFDNVRARLKAGALYYNKKPGEPTLGQAIAFDMESSNLLNKYRRYESFIDRSVFKALHELQRLQAVRRNGSHTVAPPAVLDINLTGVEE